MLRKDALEILKRCESTYELGERGRDGKWRFVEAGCINEELWKTWKFKVASNRRNAEIF